MEILFISSGQAQFKDFETDFTLAETLMILDYPADLC